MLIHIYCLITGIIAECINEHSVGPFTISFTVVNE